MGSRYILTGVQLALIQIWAEIAVADDIGSLRSDLQELNKQIREKQYIGMSSKDVVKDAEWLLKNNYLNKEEIH
jgi:hypothetical protein